MKLEKTVEKVEIPGYTYPLVGTVSSVEGSELAAALRQWDLPEGSHDVNRREEIRTVHLKPQGMRINVQAGKQIREYYARDRGQREQESKMGREGKRGKKARWGERVKGARKQGIRRDAGRYNKETRRKKQEARSNK
jgi:hypothetical protein